MPTDWADRAWVGLAVLLAGVAAWGVLWAFFGDAWRTRAARRAGALRRCGKCWYDMAGVAGLKCPECGWEARGEKGLARGRRRWWVAGLVCVLLAPAWVAWEMPVVRRHGWPRVMPTLVLAACADDYDQPEGTRWVWDPWDWELHRRRVTEVLGSVSRRLVAERTRRRWAKQAAVGEEVAVFVVGDLSVDALDPILLVPSWSDSGEWYRRDPIQPSVFRATSDFGAAIREVVERLDGRISVRDTTDRLVISGSSGSLELVRNLLVAMRRVERWRLVSWSPELLVYRAAAPGEPRVDGHGFTVVSAGPVLARLSSDGEGLSYQGARVLRDVLHGVMYGEPSEVDAERGAVIASGMVVLDGPDEAREAAVELLDAWSRCRTGACENTPRATVWRVGMGSTLRGGEQEAAEIAISWDESGHVEPQLFRLGNRVVLVGEPEGRAAANRVMSALVACGNDGKVRELDDGWTIAVLPIGRAREAWRTRYERMAFDRMMDECVTGETFAGRSFNDPTAIGMTEAGEGLIVLTKVPGMIDELRRLLKAAEAGPAAETSIPAAGSR